MGISTAASRNDSLHSFHHHTFPLMRGAWMHGASGTGLKQDKRKTHSTQQYAVTLKIEHEPMQIIKKLSDNSKR
jgi:hypothetical protein